MSQLTGKHILVVGASSGMGRVFSRMISEEGAKLTILARNEERLNATISELKGEGHNKVICDITNEEQIKEVVPSIEPLDGVVFCAGISEYVPVKFVTTEKMEKIFQTNYFGHISLLRMLLKKKLVNKEASLVFISSLSSIVGVPGTLMYASSKAAINSAVKVLASELASQKIRVNAICPGIVKTEMLASTNLSEEQFAEQEAQYPLGLGTPEDVGYAVLYHLSDGSRWLTGNIMILDGGNSLQ